MYANEVVDLSKPMYLRQATMLNDFERGCFNFVFANVGAGKTTFVGKKLPEILDYDGFFIFLAPYNSLKQQTIESGLFLEEDEDFRKALQGFTVFDEEITLDQLSELHTRKVVLTTQNFFWSVQKNPEIWNQVGVLVMDEVDHVLFNLPVWSQNKSDPFKQIDKTILKHMDDVYMIGLTATNQEKLMDEWGPLAHKIHFKEELREIKLHSKVGYSNLKAAFKTLPKDKGKVAVYIRQVKSAKTFKDELEEMGYKVDLLVSDTAKEYQMNAHERKLKETIEQTGDGDFQDVFIFNATLERGVSLHNLDFTHVIVHNSNKTIQEQVFGRFRYSGLIGYYLLPADERNKLPKNETNEYAIPSEFINAPLAKVNKDKLADFLNWQNPANGRQLGWTTIKRLLEPFYDISEQTIRINGKRTRVSIITLKEES